MEETCANAQKNKHEVLVETVAGEAFHGTIIRTNSRRISLQNAVSVKTGENSELLSLNFSEVANVKIVGGDDDQQSSEVTEIVKGLSIKSTSPTDKATISRHGDVGQQNYGRELEAAASSRVDDDDSPPVLVPTCKQSEPPTDYYVVDVLDDTFSEAIIHINKENEIGFVIDTATINNRTDICWILIASKSAILLFDMITLGQEAITQGLGAIIESENIIKVIHDCRNYRRVLFKQYNLKLENVYDTQVADVCVYRNQHGGKLPSSARPLSACLMAYLNVEQQEVKFEHTRTLALQNSPTAWSKRPASALHMRAAAQSVKYLLGLRQVTLEAMLLDFNQAVKLYLSASTLYAQNPMDLPDTVKKQLDPEGQKDSGELKGRFEPLIPAANKPRSPEHQSTTSRPTVPSNSTTGHQFKAESPEPRGAFKPAVPESGTITQLQGVFSPEPRGAFKPSTQLKSPASPDRQSQSSSNRGSQSENEKLDLSDMYAKIRAPRHEGGVATRGKGRGALLNLIKNRDQNVPPPLGVIGVDRFAGSPSPRRGGARPSRGQRTPLNIIPAGYRPEYHVIPRDVRRVFDGSVAY